jgi:hypothetical protein
MLCARVDHDHERDHPTGGEEVAVHRIDRILPIQLSP